MFFIHISLSSENIPKLFHDPMCKQLAAKGRYYLTGARNFRNRSIPTNLISNETKVMRATAEGAVQIPGLFTQFLKPSFLLAKLQGMRFTDNVLK